MVLLHKISTHVAIKKKIDIPKSQFWNFAKGKPLVKWYFKNSWHFWSSCADGGTDILGELINH